jgi:hypothetical protein
MTLATAAGCAFGKRKQHLAEGSSYTWPGCVDKARCRCCCERCNKKVLTLWRQLRAVHSARGGSYTRPGPYLLRSLVTRYCVTLCLLRGSLLLLLGLLWLLLLLGLLPLLLALSCTSAAGAASTTASKSDEGSGCDGRGTAAAAAAAAAAASPPCESPGKLRGSLLLRLHFNTPACMHSTA